jgi:hypothetical protein
MATSVSFASSFLKDMKGLIRKYPKVNQEIKSLVAKLEKDERPGDLIPGLLIKLLPADELPENNDSA